MTIGSALSAHALELLELTPVWRHRPQGSQAGMPPSPAGLDATGLEHWWSVSSAPVGAELRQALEQAASLAMRPLGLSGLRIDWKEPEGIKPLDHQSVSQAALGLPLPGLVLVWGEAALEPTHTLHEGSTIWWVGMPDLAKGLPAAHRRQVWARLLALRTVLV